MRASLKKSIAVSLAALTLGVGLAAWAGSAAAFGILHPGLIPHPGSFPPPRPFPHPGPNIRINPNLGVSIGFTPGYLSCMETPGASYQYECVKWAPPQQPGQLFGPCTQMGWVCVPPTQ